MLKWFPKLLHDKKGFTLIELMIVVVIIGILAAIAIPQFANSAEKGKRGKAMADLKTLGTAAEMYYAEKKSKAPGSLDELKDAGYLRTVPKTPWGEDYQYSTSHYGSTPFTLYYIYYPDGGSGEKVYYPDGLEASGGLGL